MLHANGFSDAELDNFKHQMRVNILHTIIALCRATNLNEFSTPAKRDDAVYFASINVYETELTPTIATRIEELWNEMALREVYDRRSTLQLQSNAKYLLESAVRVADPFYEPTEQDILTTKIRTTGVVELQFILDGVKFKVLDVGGQRAERKKWHIFFPDVSALIFVVALDDYDLKLREDEKVNRMEDSMTLFSQICNMPIFGDTSIILFLNKKDLFKEKLLRSDLTLLFPDYPGGDYKFACSFVERKYLEKLNTNRKLYSHFTCGISTKNIRQVFNDVRTSILLANLQATGF